MDSRPHKYEVLGQNKGAEALSYQLKVLPHRLAIYFQGFAA